MSAKIKDVARVAGVSVTSVSRVINGGEHISAKLEKKVRRAIEELNYSPSLIAKSLKRNKTNLIGVIIPDITSNFQASILSYIEDTAGKKGYNLLISNIVEDTDKVVKYLNIYQEMRVDGIILMHGKMNEDIRTFLERTTIPVVTQADLGIPLTSVHIDDYQGAYEATSYLVNNGHRRIAMITGDLRDISAGKHRLEGFLAACQHYQIEVDSSMIKYGDYKINTGYRLMNELLDEGSPVQAVFAASDEMAVGAINCLHDRGLSVPGDVSVIGFDGSQIADIIKPALTTIRQPIKQMGQVTVELLLDLIESVNDTIDAGKFKRVVLPHHLHVGSSCRKSDSDRERN
ncbi:LacI family DNA-binding transcriptional regulator [Paenibacillus pinihumi]|uniref:LacI family DNA-binding transcriptional regulator n=1 Tax=Paenibacillus pinihumi TaxID=669462 RepID=UPI000424C184|nr:LacI family DNA-binding transcriptional regulator [Paenibacillus pinihumi]